MDGDIQPAATLTDQRSIAATLRAQHDHVRALARELAAMTDSPPPSDTEEFSRLRVAISRALRDHFNAEDQALGGAMWSREGVPATLLSDWESQRQLFRQSYSQHLRDWPLADALRDWRGYGKAAAACIKLGEALTQIEDTQIYPLISAR